MVRVVGVVVGVVSRIAESFALSICVNSFVDALRLQYCCIEQGARRTTLKFGTRQQERERESQRLSIPSDYESSL
jgi:hypothetical protein